ncbi:hypothetical protein ABG067_000603 [Albugo candida]
MPSVRQCVEFYAVVGPDSYRPYNNLLTTKHQMRQTLVVSFALLLSNAWTSQPQNVRKSPDYDSHDKVDQDSDQRIVEMPLLHASKSVDYQPEKFGAILANHQDIPLAANKNDNALSQSDFFRYELSKSCKESGEEAQECIKSKISWLDRSLTPKKKQRSKPKSNASRAGTSREVDEPFELPEEVQKAVVEETKDLYKKNRFKKSVAELLQLGHQALSEEIFTVLCTNPPESLVDYCVDPTDVCKSMLQNFIEKNKDYIAGELAKVATYAYEGAKRFTRSISDKFK